MNALQLTLFFPLLFAFGCVEHLAHRVDVERQGLTDPEYAAELVAGLPSWSHTMRYSAFYQGDFSSSDIALYAFAAEELSSMSESSVRAGAALALEEAYEEGYLEGLLVELNLFVLWRALFNIPSSTRTSQMRWRGPHAYHARYNTWTSGGDEYYDNRWPVIFDTSGAITSIKSSRGGRGGYLALVDYDHLASVYAFRSFP